MQRPGEHAGKLSEATTPSLSGVACARSSVDRALPSGGRGRKFESCRARLTGVVSAPVSVVEQRPRPSTGYCNSISLRGRGLSFARALRGRSRSTVHQGRQEQNVVGRDRVAPDGFCRVAQLARGTQKDDHSCRQQSCQQRASWASWRGRRRGVKSVTAQRGRACGSLDPANRSSPSAQPVTPQNGAAPLRAALPSNARRSPGRPSVEGRGPR
jgi:hypothetical protein